MMQHVATTMEEQIIAKLIREECAWEKLPKRLQILLSSRDEWHSKVKEHCIKRRLPWNECFARKTCKESEYYEDMMRYLRKTLALFPYHLSEYVCRIMRISPFKYYCDMLYEVMRNEQPYDHIPNFSAADALRLTGIGRNEYIDIMNRCRSKKLMWKLNKSIVRELLPTQPIDFPIESWWGICLVNFTLEEFRSLSEEEMATIDKICKEEATMFVLFDPAIIRGLYRRGLIYFDVPVFPDDRLKVLKLEGFVSNREQSYEDPTEELLYALFVVSSEHATVAELASTLQADLHNLQAAASIACRLGWAVKAMDPASILQDSNIPGSPSSTANGDEEGTSFISLVDDASERNSEFQADAGADNAKLASNTVRVAFIVDANITSYLMMGSLSPGLKSHAVTLYEAGKLEDASVAELCVDLQTLEGRKFEGELQEFANHGFSLRYALECIRSGGITANAVAEDAGNLNTKKVKRCRVDVLRCESLAGLAPTTLNRLLHRDYNIIVDMVPLPPSSIFPGSASLVNFGPPAYAATTPWMKLMLYEAAGAGPLSIALMKGQRLRLLPPPLDGCEKALLWAWDGSSVGGLGGKFDGSLVDGNILLHCLNSLLRYSAVLVQPLATSELNEFGKPITKDIPLPLIDLDGSYVSLDKEIDLRTEELAQVNSTLMKLANELRLSTIGYIQMIRIQKVDAVENVHVKAKRYEWVPLSLEFGIPLFSPTLCQMICNRVIKSQLIQANASTEHHEAMKMIRMRLFDISRKYHATGPVANLIYDNEKFQQLLHNINETSAATGDSTVSVADGSGNQEGPGKYTETQIRPSKIVQFEGDLVRSYALPPPDFMEKKMTDAVSATTASNEDNYNDDERKDATLPGVNLLFDCCCLRPFLSNTCLQGRLPISLISEALKASDALQSKKSNAS